MDSDFKTLSQRQSKKYNIVAGKYGETQFETYKKQENMIANALNPEYKILQGKEGYFEYDEPTSEPMMIPQKKYDPAQSVADPTLVDKFSLLDSYAQNAGVRIGVCSSCQTAKKIRAILDLFILTMGIVVVLMIIKKLGTK